MANKTCTVVVTETVQKLILRLPASIATRIENSLLQLEENPRLTGLSWLNYLHNRITGRIKLQRN